MARPKKKAIKLTQDSFLSIAQEAYNELVEQRSTCIRTINENKNTIQVEDMHDLVNINKANTDLLKLIDNTIDKKLALVKLMSQLSMKSGEGVSSEDSGELTPEDMAMLKEMFSEDKGGDNPNMEYKID